MNAKTDGIRPARRRAVTAAVCSAILALVGGALISAPASASDVPTSAPCATGRLISLNGDPLSIDPLACGTSAAPTTTPAPAPAPAPTAPVSAGSPTTSGGSIGTVADDPTAPTRTETASAAARASAPLSNIMVASSSDSVYPVKDGYLDDVRFEIRALGPAGQLVPVQGTAILTKGGTVAQSWTLDTPTTVLSWDGRVAGDVRQGVYTLTVTLYAPDGSTHTTQKRVRVLSKHLVRRAVVVRSTVRTNDTRASMPAEVLKAYAKGPVTVAVRTRATVTGPAKLLFSNDGTVRSLTLRNGVHTGRAGIVPMGFESVTITHRWAKGAADLKSVEAIWTYYTLV